VGLIPDAKSAAFPHPTANRAEGRRHFSVAFDFAGVESGFFHSRPFL